MKEKIEMETVTDYTANPEYMKTWHQLIAKQGNFMEVVRNSTGMLGTTICLTGDFGTVHVGHLRRQHAATVEQAYDLRMRLAAYWKIVVLRLVDELALHILYSVKKLVEEELEAELVDEIIGSQAAAGIEKLLDESPATAAKRERLCKSIELLQESKQVVASIMDRTGAN